MKIVNLTPHSIDILAAAGEPPTHSFPPSGQDLRVPTDYSFAAPLECDGDPESTIPTCGAYYATLDSGLPQPNGETIYLVSLIAAQGISDERLAAGDIFVPDTGAGAIRENGRIVGVSRLIRGDLLKFASRN